MLPVVLVNNTCIIWQDYALFFQFTWRNTATQYKDNQMNQNDISENFFVILKISKLHDFIWLNKSIGAKLPICEKLSSELVFCTNSQVFFLDIFLRILSFLWEMNLKVNLGNIREVSKQIPYLLPLPKEEELKTTVCSSM